MGQGVQCFNSSGNLTFDTPDRLGRVIYSGPANASGISNQTWTQVVDSSLASQLWAVMIPMYALDSIPSNELLIKVGSISLDVSGQPGKLLIAGNWYDSNTGSTTDYPYQNSTLIYGVY